MFLHLMLYGFRHAKRTTVSLEDVRLCSRRSPSLLDFITAQGEQLRAEKEAETGGQGAKQARKTTTSKGKGKKNT